MSVEEGMQWKTRFTNVVYIGNKLWPNDVDVNLHFIPLTNDAHQQNIAFDKIKYCFIKVFQNSVFIQSDEKLFNQLSKFSDQVVDFCDRPVDQITGVTILAKLNQMVGDHLKVNLLEIESWQGENLRFLINEDSPEWDILEGTDQDSWWFNDKPIFNNFDKNQLTWADVGITIKDNDRFRIIKGGTT